MRLLTIMGTRPEIIRLSIIIRKLDGLCEHILVHTGQNFDRNLKDIFMDQLGVRKPNYELGAQGSFGEQMAVILPGVEKIFADEQPDRFLVLGDTNSSLAAVVAKRMGISVYHMEAGNRCYDDRVPEEVNRRIVDHSSDVLMPYTYRSRENLVSEGIPGRRIYVTGNPIYEVIQQYGSAIDESPALPELGLQKQEYFLATMHRAENVDVEARLRSLTEALKGLHGEYGIPVIISTHPRTRKRMEEFGVDAGGDQVRFLEPFGFFDFVALERNARCVLSDSGTVQEECAIFGVPNVTVRDVTERPETLDCGSNMLSGTESDEVLACVRAVLGMEAGWTPPDEYVKENVSDTVVRILTGRLHPTRA